MQVVSQEFCASGAPVTVVDAEEGALGPFFVFAGCGFDDVEDDADSVFVVVSDQALMGVCGVGSDDPVAFYACFR